MSAAIIKHSDLVTCRLLELCHQEIRPGEELDADWKRRLKEVRSGRRTLEEVFAEWRVELQVQDP